MSNSEMWEYLATVGLDDDTTADQDASVHLNKMGKERWELVTVLDHPAFKTRQFYFKRRLYSSKPERRTRYTQEEWDKLKHCTDEERDAIQYGKPLDLP